MSGIVYTSSLGRADRVGRALRAGTVWVNTFLVRDLTAPFGGVGISGIGREGGNYALDFYSELKALQILEGTVALVHRRRESPCPPLRSRRPRRPQGLETGSCTAARSACPTSCSSSSPRPRR